MANKSVFASVVGKMLPRPDTVNSEGAVAYTLSPRQKLAQLAATGCVNRTFYAEAREQVEEILSAVQEVDPAYVARVAIYAREKGYMKDMPALLCAVLTLESPVLAAKVFNRVITNGRMLRTFVQIMRSGVVGRKSLGTAPKRLICNWLVEASDDRIVSAMVGKEPSLADVIKMVHPKAKDERRNALFAYIIGKPCDVTLLPEALQDFVAFKAKQSDKVPAVPFQMLTALELGKREWSEIARNARWHMLRMNLNTFKRHGVFGDAGWFAQGKMASLVAEKLRNPEAIEKAKVFPYQLLSAYLSVSEDMPAKIKDALQDALELATKNVPAIAGQVAVAVDVSGSMQWPVTGYRSGATSKVTCVDVAALLAATVLRKNKEAMILPFDWDVRRVEINGRDSVMINADRLRRIGGGGTNCSAPLKRLNEKGLAPDLVIMVSDNESWVDNVQHRATGVLCEWLKLKKRNPKAKLVCLDIIPNTHTQAKEREDILNIGGFSDNVFEVIAAFAEDRLSSDHWIGEIEKIEL